MKEKEIIGRIIRNSIIHRRVVKNSLDSIGVYQGQHRILMEISKNQYCSQKEIAISMKVSTATVAIALKKLEKSGYIKKIVNAEDNRINQIVITDKGTEVVKDSKIIFDELDNKVLANFSDEEKNVLNDYLYRIEENLLYIEKK